jgi:hypothetical protein
MKEISQVKNEIEELSVEIEELKREIERENIEINLNMNQPMTLRSWLTQFLSVMGEQYSMEDMEHLRMVSLVRLSQLRSRCPLNSMKTTILHPIYLYLFLVLYQMQQYRMQSVKVSQSQEKRKLNRVSWGNWIQ